MNELLIALDIKSKTPLYEQIYRFIRGEIQERQMLPGERLPSTRALARNLQISRSTADLAYDQLVSEGYIESVPYKGYYVSKIDGVYKIYEPQEIKAREKKEENPDYRFDFAVNGIDEEGFPDNIWRKISKEVLQESGVSLFQLGEPQGEYELREAITNYLKHARGVRCIPEQIVIGAGNDYLLLLLWVLLGNKRTVAMEDPTYKSAYLVFNNVGYQVRGIETDSQGIRMDNLEDSQADTVYVMPSHQFPLGTVMPVKRRMELLSWAAAESDRYVIEDDYDSEFRYRGKPIPALQGYDRSDRVIYMGTFSKSIAPAIRISYMVLPDSLLCSYRERGSTFSTTVSRVDQRIIETFLREGYFERHLNRMRTVYKNKHDVFLNGIKELSAICSVSGENAGVHVMVRFRNGMSEQRAVELARQCRIKVYGLSQYYIKETDPRQSDCVIMGYATLSENEITEGLKELKRVWMME